MEMFQTRFVNIFVVFVIVCSVRFRCHSLKMLPRPADRSSYEIADDYVDGGGPSWNCERETQDALAEMKSEIQNLQQLMVGLRQKLDPDFKWPTTTRPIEVESKCPSGFQYAKLVGSCYKVIYEGHSWATAVQRCHDLNPDAHLVAITTEQKNNGLKDYLKKELAKNSPQHRRRYPSWGDPYTLLWTSGQRLNETICTDEFVWKISNNTHLPLSFTYWNPGEPNCHLDTVESCLEMIASDGFKWNDVPCHKMLYPLCEYDPLLIDF